jgi:hypothetical protein
MDTLTIDQTQLDRSPLLEPKECGRVLDDVLALRERWTKRASDVPFFTLGVASYLDARQSQADYRKRAAESNPLLRDHFDWLLERVKKRVSDATGLKASWLPNAALPGFHVFLAHWAFTIAPSAVHFDTQHRLLDWSDLPGADFSDLLSFTLPIQLPATGGGLNIWNIDQRDFPDTQSKAFFDAARGLKPTLHEYRVGHIVMHSGNLLHQMAGTARMESDDRRVTLQGHGTRANGQIYLYW